MSQPVKCSHCKSNINIEVEPTECHVCPMGHVLCENCNDIARTYCFSCGGRTQRKVPDKELRELYRMAPDLFVKKNLDSDTLIFKESQPKVKTVNTKATAPPTVIGFRKWPMSFFDKIPEPSGRLSINEKAFLDALPDIIEEEPQKKVPGRGRDGYWDALPKPFNNFDMPTEVLECPILKCRFPICNIDTTRHMLQTHGDIPIEILARYSIAEFSFDVMSSRKNEIKALMRLMVPGIVKDLGNTRHKDCLPLYLLYTRVNALEVKQELQKINNARVAVYSDETTPYHYPIPDFSTDSEYAVKHPWRSNDCLLLWCAGIVPLDLPITVAISVCGRGSTTRNLGATVKVFSLHMPQSSLGIYSNTERLLLTRHDLKRMTRSGTVIDGQVCIM